MNFLKLLVARLTTLLFLQSPVWAEEAAPWLEFGVPKEPIARLQERVGARDANALCHGSSVETRSPLDKVSFPPVSIAELTPALAQVAGLVSMVSQDQRDALQALAVRELKRKGAWTTAAEKGYFKYLLAHAEEARTKADHAFAIAGAVAGGLIGGLSSGILNDLGAYNLAGQTLMDGKEAGSERLKSLRPTTFSIIQDEDAVASVIDALIERPCYFSSTDAVIVLRAK